MCIKITCIGQVVFYFGAFEIQKVNLSLFLEMKIQDRLLYKRFSFIVMYSIK